MKFIYFAEGLAFVGFGVLLGRWIGLPGVIISGIATNLMFSGLYGTYRTSTMFRLSIKEISFVWLSRPLRLFLVMFVIAASFRYITMPLPVPWQLTVNAIITVVLGGYCLWKLGLPENLQKELGGYLVKLRERFGV